jgi:Uma2 family endonuclease
MSIAPSIFTPTPSLPVALPGRDSSWVEEEAPAPSIVRLSVEQYEKMIEQGILEENNQIEFLEGILVQKMTKKPARWISAKLVSDALERLNVAGYFVHRQDPVDTSDSVPEPDAALVQGTPRDYMARNPGAADSCLVVEVADTSLVRDRGWKKRIYARAGVPVYWIVNLVDRQVEVFTLPSGTADKPDFARRQVFIAADEVAVWVNGVEVGRIAVKDMLP